MLVSTTNPSSPSLAKLRQPIKQWFETELGQQLLATEQQLLDQVTPRLFGYHLLQISVLDLPDLTRGSPAGHRFMLAAEMDGELAPNTLVGDMESLPLANECIDAVVLHHALDFAQSPHDALREAIRVLRPGGRLIIIGFNPHSFWGLHRLWKRKSKQVPWVGHFMARRRMHDWLKLLEMKSERADSGFFRPPWHSSRWMDRMQFCERWGQRSHSLNGAFWMLTACKETGAAATVGQSWKRRFVFPLPVAQSSRVGRGGVADKAGTARIYPFPRLSSSGTPSKDR
ncbi:SAM-dependent methyltransferase [Motiliproteus coralliicola]|uniref:SAM-dependent methyltransferase n=1 Tax=Motiliproteus coralliicola TaxID=2283196 RepID=A0A369WQ47_9GAMM|nr:class I SAM-dependent methyltransferase [Motiliproteus coralliicola]RDE24200.1 SAM-dependent methyltransferase [Motiliproteus coralliicola]